MNPITKVEMLEDRVRVSYHLRQPYGEPDENGVKEILYRDIRNLPKPPEISNKRTDANWEELIGIGVPKVGRTICFRYTSMRSGGGPSEGGLDGPYLREERADGKNWDDDEPYFGSELYTKGMIRRGEDPYENGNVDRYGNAIHD